MKSQILRIFSVVSLIAILISSTMVFTGSIDIETNKTVVVVLTLAWFLSAPFWMNKTDTQE